MRLRNSLLSLLSVLCVAPAFAGWQYDGYYVDDSYYTEDNTKFVIGFRGGLSWANAKIQNNVGNLEADYYYNTYDGSVLSGIAYDIYLDRGGDATDWVYAGSGDLSSLPANGKFSKWAFTAGANIGFTVPYHPNWRLEAAYDHIAETDYNKIPLFKGDVTVTGGDVEGAIPVSSGGVTSTVSTDIVSAMVYYDFFDGKGKPSNTIIPYIGLGVGYATSKTTLKLADIYGDLSDDSDLQNYGGLDANGIIQFTPPSDKSKYPTSENVAGIAALGISYGIAEYTFIDLGARVIYIPKITWNLVNADGSQHREWFSAKNMIYSNFTVGLRFEF